MSAGWLAALRPRAARERALVALLCLVAAAYGLTLAWDWSRGRSEQAQAVAAERVALAKSLAAGPARPLAAGLVRAPTHTIAALSAQSYLETVLTEAGLADVSVQAAVRQKAAQAGELGVIEVTLEGSFDWTRFVELLKALAPEETGLAVAAVEVEQGEAPSMMMRLRMLYQLEGSGV